MRLYSVCVKINNEELFFNAFAFENVITLIVLYCIALYCIKSESNNYEFDVSIDFTYL